MYKYIYIYIFFLNTNPLSTMCVATISSWFVLQPRTPHVGLVHATA